jgi:signal-transduction protein with cAMP-binding, CBS, and nucleotidyltransferase domain
MKLLSAEQLLKKHELSSFTHASVFGALSESSILWLLQNGKIHSLEKGDHIFTQGQPGNSFHVILSGQISYYKFHDDHYAFIKDFKTGEQIGFMSMIALHDRVGRAEVRQDTVTLEIDSELFHVFHNDRPLEFGILMMNLARDMARTLRSVDNLVVEKSQGQ